MKGRMNRRQFLRAGIGAVLSAAAGIISYTRYFEPHWVDFVCREMEIESLPEGLEGARLVQLSDIHIGPRVADSFLAEVFESIRKLEPEIVVMTGDFISYRSEDQILQLGRLSPFLPRGRRATAAVLGNHDYGPGWSSRRIAGQVQRTLDEGGVRVLRNESINVDGLAIIGADDLWAGECSLRKTLRGWDRKTPALLLCHNPDTVDLPDWPDYRGWILAGHTHGGQCRIPFFPPLLLPVRNRAYAAGSVSLTDGRKLYVNRGVGHLLPVRFGVRPEVTVFTLRRA